MLECGLPMMSDETRGSSLYSRMPFIFPSAAFLNALLTSFTDVFFFTLAVRSVIEPQATGTLIAMPSIFPVSSGKTSKTALLAPVVAGIMFNAAVLPFAGFLSGLSTRACDEVYAWTVVNIAFSISKFSFIILTIGARQFVVQDATEIIFCSFFSSSELTPGTIVRSGFPSFIGAVTMTCFAPASKCFDEPFLLTNAPVDSIAMSTSNFAHGNLDGSFSLKNFIVFPSIIKSFPLTETFLSYCP